MAGKGSLPNWFTKRFPTVLNELNRLKVQQARLDLGNGCQFAIVLTSAPILHPRPVQEKRSFSLSLQVYFGYEH